MISRNKAIYCYKKQHGIIDYVFLKIWTEKKLMIENCILYDNSKTPV